MRRTTVVAVAGLLVGGGAAAGLAAEDALRGVGLLPSHGSEQHYYMSTGIAPSGRPSSAQALTERRTHIVVPEHYGDLFQITQDGKDAVLWYRGEDGSIRNAVLSGASVNAYQVERRPTDRFELILK